MIYNNNRSKKGSAIYSIAVFIKNFSIPSIKPLHYSLFLLRKYSLIVVKRLYQMFWIVPLFKSVCDKCGKYPQVFGMPTIRGKIKLYVGDKLSIDKDVSLLSDELIGEPKLHIGNYVVISENVDIFVEKSVTIGDHVLIAKGVYISDNDNHPVSSEERRDKKSVNINTIAPVVIEDNVWIGQNAMIMKGVTIGENSIVGAGAVITKNVPSNSIVVREKVRVLKDFLLKIGDI
jgi:acetyltransferase-like isoleucine patch superfamily enzyme